MTVLDNFVAEMLQTAIPKNPLIEKMLLGLTNEKPPQFNIPAKKFDFKTGQHGLVYDYQAKTVTISYLVAASIFQDVTLSFQTFHVILEGIAICIRQQKW